MTLRLCLLNERIDGYVPSKQSRTDGKIHDRSCGCPGQCRLFQVKKPNRSQPWDTPANSQQALCEYKESLM
jgi:hypothetical protein